MKNTVLTDLDSLGVSRQLISIEEFTAKAVAPKGELYPVDITLADGQRHHIQVAANLTLLSIA